ncbi:MAG: hypothetical protein FMNOHCHN_01852 [Ignavibacteriaceae bacterium]|nr:hypothetical protein [Ignavibacteriaceae bacterium]
MFSLKQVVLVLFIIAAMGSSGSLYAQNGNLPGQIISAEQADRMFGPVIHSHTFNKKMLMNITKNISDVLLFNLIDGQLVILDGQRNPIHPRNFQVSPDQEFHMYDVRKINELMNLTNAKTITIEIRERGVLTLTTSDGNYGNNRSGIESNAWTLEFAILCPPYCLD